MKQPSHIASDDRAQAQDRAATAAGDILKIIRCELIAWLHREPANLAGARAAIEQRLRAELGQPLRPPPYPPDEP